MGRTGLAGRSGIFLLTVFALFGCQARAPAPSGTIEEILVSVSDCMHKEASNDDYVLVTKCEPLGPSHRMEGIWIVGFERSSFRELNSDGQFENEAWLVAPEAITTRAYRPNTPGFRSFRISFNGRVSKVPMLRDTRQVVLDELLSMREVKMPA